jgi:putative PIN family toxin of toxin-antitoxin system
MQKIIIDTNVFVSSLIQKNYPYYIINELFSTSNIEICISDEVFKEYYDVLNREKFSKYSDFSAKAQTLLVEIQKRAIKYFPGVKLQIIDDVGDNKFLELAETSNANFIITGNTNDFTLQQYKTTKIVTPKEFWEIHLMQQ